MSARSMAMSQTMARMITVASAVIILAMVWLIAIDLAEILS